MAEETTIAAPEAAVDTGEVVENGEGEGEEEAMVLPPPCVDLTDYPLKIDFFEQMHLLDESVVKIPGAANFRQVPGFPIYGVGQPTADAFPLVLDKVLNGVYPDGAGEERTSGRVIWFNMRQEPVVYINGTPFAPRTPNNLHENIEVSTTVGDILVVEEHYVKIIEQRCSADPNASIKIERDKAYVENPMERENIEELLIVETVKGLESVYREVQDKGFTGLQVVRIPIVEEKAPDETCFDQLLEILKNEPASTPCIFSCQMGRGRTTLGEIVACLVKEIQITTELRRMGDIGLLSPQTVGELIQQKFESQLPKAQEGDDPLINGEFDVIKELLTKVPECREGKKKIDRVIDICGVPPRGNGLQNLRECVIETKWKYDVAPEEKQGPDGYQKTFKTWMDEHAELRGVIAEGKDKLEWYRQVDPAKLNTLKELIASPNYKENLGVLIRTIYDFAFLTYADLPRGPIKNNSMRKLAAKTLMEILPPNIADRVNQKLDEDPNTSHDFVTLVGLVAYYGGD